MVIEIDFQSDEALYTQLMNQIIMGIATSTIHEGDTLPSVRQLADNIGINMHTVNKAYNVLRQEGFLQLDRRRGAVICIDEDKLEALQDLKEQLSGLDLGEKLLIPCSMLKGDEEIFLDEKKVYDKLLLILESTGKSKELKEYLSQYFECIDRGNFMYEVIQKGYSKATGIHFLCEYLGKTLEDCYSFGDSENDRAMLEAVPNSIAMGNAQESIKNTCSYVTEDVENHGIYKAMKHFGLI